MASVYSMSQKLRQSVEIYEKVPVSYFYDSLCV